MKNEPKDDRKGLYRSRDGMFLGVCKGLANYLDFSVFWMRVLAVLLVIFTSVIPAVVVYLILGLMMKPEPVIPFETDEDREFYDSYMSSRPLAIKRLRRTYDALDRRIQRIESIVTSREYQWKKRMDV